MRPTIVAIRELSFEGNMRGSSARTWISSPSIELSVRTMARAASLTRGAGTRLAQASAWARTSRSVSTASCTRVRRSWLLVPRVLLAQVVVRRLHARVLHDLDRLGQRATVHAQPHLVGTGGDPRRRERFER